jgi:hypothetical protein
MHGNGLAQAVKPARALTFDIAFAAPHGFRGLRDAEPFDVPQHDRRPHAGRQGGEQRQERPRVYALGINRSDIGELRPNLLTSAE